MKAVFRGTNKIMLIEAKNNAGLASSVDGKLGIYIHQDGHTVEGDTHSLMLLIESIATLGYDVLVTLEHLGVKW